MGLDAVEFVMEVEDHFGVTLSDDDAFNFYTMGQLHDFLLEKCEGRRRAGCPTQSAFYPLRRALIDEFQLERRSLHPKTEVLPLLGKWRRHYKWRHLEKKLELSLPSLMNRTDAGVRLGAAIAVFTSFTIITILSRDPFLGIAVALFSLLPGVFFGFGLGLFCIPTVYPSYKTLGGLARGIVASNYQAFQTSEEPQTENDPTWNRLCSILVDQLDVRRESLTRDTRFLDIFH